jgi:hypothetical protein
VYYTAGGDPAYAGLKRLPKVVATHPDNARRFLGGWKGLPRDPSHLNGSAKTYKASCVNLKKQTGTTIALTSLSEMGEAPNSTDPVQHELNRPFAFGRCTTDAFRQFIQRQSLDKIARINGWQFHIDGLHLNSRGDMILADLVQKFLDSIE